MIEFKVGDHVYIADSAADGEYCGIAYMQGDTGTILALLDSCEVLVEFDALSTMAEAGSRYFVPAIYLKHTASED